MLRKIISLYLCLPLFLWAETKIVLIGDSNTYGVPAREDGWAYMLKCDLEQEGYDARVYNYGVGMATSNQCLQILDIALDSVKPDIVIFAGGLIDVLFHYPLNELYSNIENSIIKCLAHDAIVLFGVIDFSCWEHKYAYNTIYLLQSNSVFLNIAYKCPVFAFEYLNSQVLEQGCYNVGDWIHPNQEGNKLVYSRIKNKLFDVFARMGIKPIKAEG